MSATGDKFRELHQYGREKRLCNLQFSTQIVRDSGLPFEITRDGFQIKFRTPKGAVTFSPTTGRYIGASLDGRGVFNLIRDLAPLMNPNEAARPNPTERKAI